MVKCINGNFVTEKQKISLYTTAFPLSQDSLSRICAGKCRWTMFLTTAYMKFISMQKALTNWGISQNMLPFFLSGEDCLYLEIWKVDESSEEKSLSGYGFTVALLKWAELSTHYECHNFVKENPNVIVVSIEYRLGIFEFLHLSHIVGDKDYPDVQNLGLLNRMMALKWIYENIEGFGGNSDNVAILVESAGAASVTLFPLVFFNINDFNIVMQMLT